MCLDRHLLAHSSAAVPHQPLASSGATPKAQTESNIEWTVEKIIVWLTIHQGEIKDDHVKLTGYTLQSTKASEKRIRHGPDLFANIGTPRLMGKSSNTMRIKFKQHLKGGRDKEEGHYAPICTKTNVDRVPPYRFHPVEIKKNVLAPNTMLTFAPHLRDLKSSEETQYDMWLKELEDMDRRSGFKPTNLEKKKQLVLQGEREATLALYLDSWLQRMAIPGCGKSQLIRYSNVLALESDETLSPQQKGKLLDFLNAAPGVKKAVKMFTDAFEHVFKYGQPPARQAELRRVVKLMDETADNITGLNPAINGATIPRVDDENEDELAESNLSTYCILGCLICFSHSCDHGEYDDKNTRHTFSMGSFSQALRRRRSPVHNDSGATPHIKPYRRQCYWRDGDRDPICLAAEFLNRDCDEVHIEFKSMGIPLPQPKLSEAPMKNLPWYDRRRKVLLGDWQDHTTSHAHQRREYLELCYHEGPCMPGSCACVDAGVLCEKFCGCTVDNCAYKFTGCGCLSQGKTCLDNKKDKPCICCKWRLQDDSGSEYDELIPGNGMGGDGGGRSLEEMEPPLRLRRQVRTSTETPTRQVELPNNTRSKRGGARPGSGRPRKHQRPASKPPTPPEHAPEAEPEAESEADLETAPAPAPAPDPESTSASKNSDKMETEIADSDDNKPCNRARQGDLKMEGDGTVMDMYRYGSGAIERGGQDGHRPSSETTILDCGIEQGFDCGMVLPKENKEKMKENNHVVDICD
ncbi:hypothetical protein MGU_11245 [Metarhizium guizhouense ARSEF 977]|uniref:CXC domain-containing protein n=1 Tax=Metarhizium guizhouense (strain ARSEF 977) TaxID=1276136 RepID=A0A0B4G477_METGA|nr:hypothetical protein MGU_11245 [Metarhizium guizhouense ARSEF 977]